MASNRKCDFRQKKNFYHKICKTRLESNSRSAVNSEKIETDWPKKRHMSGNVYKKICFFIEENIIKNNSCYFLSFLETLYSHYLKKEYEQDENLSSVTAFCSRYLGEDLLQTFRNKINIVTINKKKNVKPYGAIILQNYDLETLEKRDIVERAALIFEFFKG